jgi:S-sulfosulfanyl-L-cysteine sulfohydrolase
MNRREFLGVLAAASASLALDSRARSLDGLYDFPRFGNVSLLHYTDCHAQLLPIYFREPDVNLGVGSMVNQPPHLVGDALLRYFGASRGSADAHALTYLDFVASAKKFGKVGGFAHLATLVKRLRAERPGCLLLDGGDPWQGSATSLWTKGQDMIDAQKLLGVDIMTGHWEFTYGAERVKQVVEGDFKGKVEFLAQNIHTADFGDPVFAASTLREINGVPVGIIGQAFPYTPVANPRYFVADWTFGIKDDLLQQRVDELRAKGAQVVVLLSHNGMDVDLKLATRVSGIDLILGGHTHDGVPRPSVVGNRGGKTLVTNAGSNGKFLAVADLEVSNGKLADYRYRLLPVFSDLLPADPDMARHIDAVRAPYLAKLGENLAVTADLLYRRGNFNGSFDQLLLDALLAEHNAEIAFSPGFRWGTTLLPNETITFERLMDQTAITYPMTTLTEMSGETIKTVLEDVCDNLFNPDPYYQQGGDMVRVGGMTYACEPGAAIGSRISDMRLNGKPIEANKIYRVAGWAPVTEGVSGEPVWELAARYLRARKNVAPSKLNLPRLIGINGNRGIA